MSDVKEKIMTAALRLFAAKGLKGVTVREICNAAGANVALVNYHFHNKEGLYGACLDRLFSRGDGRDMSKLDEGVRDARTWKAAVREWVCGFSRGIRSTENGAELIAGFFRHEVTHPSVLQDQIRERYVIPVRNCLTRLIGMAAADRREAVCWVESIWAQMSAYALVDRSWHDLFRPGGIPEDAWGETYADFVCRRIFASLKYAPKRV